MSTITPGTEVIYIHGPYAGLRGTVTLVKGEVLVVRTRNEFALLPAVLDEVQVVEIGGEMEEAA